MLTCGGSSPASEREAIRNDPNQLRAVLSAISATTMPAMIGAGPP